jgi:hypothetical protein
MPWYTCSAATIVMLLEATAVIKRPLTFRTDTPSNGGWFIGGAGTCICFQFKNYIEMKLRLVKDLTHNSVAEIHN